ncbi:hypothetical protein V6B16_00910 [Salinimicrobium catena]|uniref:hypothetical protein n=1 Tax=Salinimicrobium catena TaxID=390640 RepID=UPI002FE4B431
MAVVIVKHKVENYKKWEGFYNDDVQRRQNAGLKEIVHGRNVDSPNEVYLIFESDDAMKAKEFLRDPELKEVMDEAGVLDKPEMIILEK